MKKLWFFLLIVGFVFFGCDNGNDTNSFVSRINETISNDVDTLGLVGTYASSSNEGVATVEIVSGKIKITSLSSGTTVITVSVGSNSATINITISSTGSISIGTIVKYSGSSNNTDPKSITLTGFTDLYTGEWQIWLIPFTTSVQQTDIVAVLHSTPVGGTISGNLLAMSTDGQPPTENWTGSGDYYIFLIPRHPNDHLTVNRYLSKTKVSFTSAVTTYSFTDNFEINDITAQ